MPVLGTEVSATSPSGASSLRTFYGLQEHEFCVFSPGKRPAASCPCEKMTRRIAVQHSAGLEKGSETGLATTLLFTFPGHFVE